MDFQSIGIMLFPTLELPPRSMIGMQESIEILGDYEIDRSLHGKAILLRPSWGPQDEEMYAISLTVSGDNVQAPSLDDLKAGTEIDYYSGEWRVKTIPAGQTSITLARDPVPGSVYGSNPRILRSNRVALNVVGRVVSLPAPLAHPVSVNWRAIYECVVGPRGSSTMARMGRSRGFSFRMEEREPQS